jgi:hypothetical protein
MDKDLFYNRDDMYSNRPSMEKKLIKDVEKLNKDVESLQGSAGTGQAFEDLVKQVETAEGSLAVLSQANAGVSCKALGMVPNDNSKASSNYTLLLDAVRRGVKVLVDDVYYIESPYTVADSNTEVNYELALVGSNPMKSKLISLGGRLFNAKKDVLIENVSIECPSNTKITYVISLVAPYQVSLTIRNNFVSGNVRFVDSTIPQDYDFETQYCGVPQIDIDSNTFNDVYNSGGSRIIFRLADTPVNEAVIRGNRVTNFSYVFYSNGITNGHPSEEFIRDNSRRNFIEDNKVICTDDYDPKVKNGGFEAAYFCFALLESYSCECRNNIFEGFHMFDSPNTVVYDNYFSVTELIYEGNTWKNIVNFTPDLQYVDIMKSKMGGTSANGTLTRTYRKNTYIVEKRYAEQFNEDPFLLRKQIDTYQEWIDHVIIEDNYFDMYTLSFNRFKYAKDYTFNNNTIVAYTVENSVNTQAFIGIVDYKAVDGSSVPRTLMFTNNNINIKNAPTGSALGSLESALVRNYTGNGDKVKVVFENNYINTYELKYILSDERSELDITNNPCLLDVRFNNNTVDVQKASHVYVLQKSFKSLNSFKNNELNVAVGGSNALYMFHEPASVATTTRYTLPLSLETELDFRYKGDQWLRVLPLKGLLDGNYKVSMQVRILSESTLEEFTVNFTIKNDGTNNIIECLGQNVNGGESSFSQKSYVLDGSANKVYSNFYIQQEDFKGTSTVNVNVSNSSTSKEIMLHSKPPRTTFNNDRVKIRMTISKT